MKRREFLIKTSSITALHLAVNNSSAKFFSRKKKILILHTNDFHSRIEPFPQSHPKHAGQGGIAQLKTAIDVRKQNNKNVLLLDSGDIIQGTPYFNFFKGELEIEWMNKAGYTASTLGNHDFDNGIDGLVKLIQNANFPFVNCNYQFSDKILAEKIKKYIVKNIGKKRIGITGVGVQLDGLVLPKYCEGVVHNSPIDEVNKIAKELKEREKCDLVIVLSHLGWDPNPTNGFCDKVLAENSENVDVILGAHTHTFFKKIETIKNKKGKNVFVNQAGWAGIQLGEIALEI